MHRQTLEVPYSPKPIQCTLSWPEETKNREDRESPSPTPVLIFTHGAGGTLSSDAIANFSAGFAVHAPILCFQGNMNLKSRVKMYSCVIENQSFSMCLGGRSMGARAAVMAATDATERLVLVSYPLHTGKETRDEILLDLAQSVKVIFVIGSRDSMCGLGQLEDVRSKLKCKTWLVVVEEADHGMSVKPKSGTEAVGKMTGEVVANWVDECEEKKTEGRITWKGEEERAEWSGWSEVSADVVAQPPQKKETPVQDPEDAIAATQDQPSKRSKSKRSKSTGKKTPAEAVSGRRGLSWSCQGMSPRKRIKR
ncbi:MAG: hypothetical protein FRX48_03170 [Lasallia pustulata]|uniref:KANL3/Tex30 alpha/beta hydrolase-like domain-containing protein n=1 Tax=Lasallia pustulata TaxID=136370 RepID=A0A5M8PWJ1_9LECA|nr:MAG: hypothetical protein FRX48_03170 [Lasallia pustulata]